MRLTNFSQFDLQPDRTEVIRVMRIAAAVCIVASLAACQSSRFDTGAGYRQSAPVRQQIVESDIEPGLGGASVGAVESSSLPPAQGAVMAPDPNFPPAPSANAGVVAGLEAATTPVAAPPTPPPATRSGAVGRWTAKEASGNCGVTLSSTPSLDLYRASTSGCSNKDLQSVNAWELRDGEVYLYARGGVVARLRDSGGQFNGVIAKSGAPLSLSK